MKKDRTTVDLRSFVFRRFLHFIWYDFTHYFQFSTVKTLQNLSNFKMLKFDRSTVVLGIKTH